MSRERGSLRRHPVVRFVVLTFAISWAAWGGVIVLDPDFSLSPMLSLLGGLGPIIAAGILSWSDGTVGEWVSRAVRWRVPVRWWIVAIVLPVILSLIGWAIFLAISDVSIAMTESPLYVVYPTVFLLVFFLQGGYGEEMGWRGYALPHLLDTYNPTVAGLLLGLVWAVWHLPLFFTRGSSQSGSFSLYLVGEISLSILLTRFFITQR